MDNLLPNPPKVLSLIIVHNEQDNDDDYLGVLFLYHGLILLHNLIKICIKFVRNFNNVIKFLKLDPKFQTLQIYFAKSVKVYHY